MPATPGLATTRGGHVAVVSPSPDQLTRSVAGFLHRAPLLGGAAVVLATPEHRAAVAHGLQALGLVPARLRRQGALVEIDAALALENFVVEGTVDAERFERFASQVLEPLGRLSGPIHVYGEMVAVLWDAGRVAAAVELEACWNALASRFTFALFCGYPAASLAAAPAAAEEVARLHQGVLVPPELTRSPGPATHVARFAADLAELARARRFVASSLPGIGEEAEAEATLIVTELAANAVVHAGSRFSVRLGIAHRQLWIAVQDGAGLLAPLAPTPGRGLGLVAALAERWGCEQLERGKVVWALLPLTREMPAPAP
ncbi:MAG: MEDS domain-containing protein [Actinomycetota bacterium]|nr:MEDS domain-containing protein [Actinomycetota bacterium]